MLGAGVAMPVPMNQDPERPIPLRLYLGGLWGIIIGFLGDTK